MLPIAGGLLDACPLSFWYQLQTCEITWWNTPAENQFIFTGQRCMEWITKHFTLLQYIFYTSTSSEYLWVVPEQLGTAVCPLGSSVLSTMPLQRMARKQQPLWNLTMH
jgi:hypothetical protein